MTIGKLAAIVIFEFSVAMFTAAVVFGILYFMLRARVNSITRAVFDAYEERRPTRVSAIAETLTNKLHLDPAIAESTATNIAHNELHFFKQFGVLLHEGGTHQSQQFVSAYSSILADIEAIAAPELEHGESTDASETEEPAESVEESAELSELIEKNAVLTAELAKEKEQVRIAMETLDNILTEYSSMFENKGDVAALDASRKRVAKTLDKLPEELNSPPPDTAAMTQEPVANFTNETGILDSDTPEKPLHNKDKLVIDNDLSAALTEFDEDLIDLDVTRTVSTELEALKTNATGTEPQVEEASKAQSGKIADSSFLDIDDDDLEELLAEGDNLFKEIAGEGA